MAFLKMRNGQLSSRYRDIAKWYRRHGEAWRVRWDYAFFQMALETNFLTYRRANGDRGDVHPRQNNFAGIGATGGVFQETGFPMSALAFWRKSSISSPIRANRLTGLSRAERH